jgi:hypothetical protein
LTEFHMRATRPRLGIRSLSSCSCLPVSSRLGDRATPVMFPPGRARLVLIESNPHDFTRVAIPFGDHDRELGFGRRLRNPLQFGGAIFSQTSS